MLSTEEMRLAVLLPRCCFHSHTCHYFCVFAVLAVLDLLKKTEVFVSIKMANPNFIDMADDDAAELKFPKGKLKKKLFNNKSTIQTR